jgi:hypothetical protein
MVYAVLSPKRTVSIEPVTEEELEELEDADEALECDELEAELSDEWLEEVGVSEELLELLELLWLELL